MSLNDLVGTRITFVPDGGGKPITGTVTQATAGDDGMELKVVQYPEGTPMISEPPSDRQVADAIERQVQRAVRVAGRVTL